MQIVILDGYTENPGDLSWSLLETYGDLTVYDRTDPADENEIVRRIGGADIVVTNKTPVTEAVLNACPHIRFIAVLATGYNVVDCAAARRRNICVSNVPAYGTQAVAQFAIAMLLEICHHAADHSRSVHAGKWSACPDFCYWDFPLIELAGKTMGIIGFGHIGMQTGRIAHALGMNVLAVSPHAHEEGRSIASYVSLDTLLAQSDVIALHCPLLPQTQGIINRETIAKMKDGAILLNNARGQLIIEQDLADALNSGKLYAAGLDVVSTEPIRPDNPLLQARNCLITPHISWASKESRQRIMDCTEKNISAFLNGCPINVVNS